MKKLISLLGTSLLALVLAVPAFAAEQPIKVYINGSNVSFTAGNPYLKNNTVLVPFRVIFEKLGLQVLYNAQTGTITGTSSSLKLSLKIGSNRATLNGTVKKMSTAPLSIGGTTYIPLRFIAEATGGTAVWDSGSRSVKIKAAVSTVTDEKDITALIHLANQYYNTEQASRFYSLVDAGEDITGMVADMDSSFELYDVKNTIESLKVLQIQGNEATAVTVEKAVRTGGLYIPDENIEYLYELIRKDGKWKIASMEVQDRTVLLTREQGMTAAVLPQATAATIKDNLSKYYQYMSAENTDAISALMTSYGEEYDAATKSDMQDYFDTYDHRYSLDNSNVFYYSPGEAAVYAETTIKDADSGESYKQSLIFLFVKSEDGAWTVDETYNLSFDGDQS